MKTKITISILFSLFYFQLSFSQNGDVLFDDTFIHTIEINSLESYTYEEFHDTLYANHLEAFYTNTISTEYLKSSVKIDGVLIDTVGVRYKGNSTFQNTGSTTIDKYPIKIDFNEFVGGQNYDGIKKLNLNNNLLDVSCMRAKLTSEIFERMGVATFRISYAKVYVNGDYRGLYSMVEQIDKTFVRGNFDENKTGYLHKTFGFAFETGQTDSFLAEWMPLKTKKSTNNYEPIKNISLAVNNVSDPEFENNVNGKFDLETYIKIQAVNLTISDLDHFSTNFYMYQNPEDTTWYMIPWDYDLAFAATNNIVEDPANYISNSYHAETLPFKRMMEIPNLRLEYRNSLCEVINHGMDSVWINNRIVELKNLISTEVENDPHFWSLGTADFDMYLDADYSAPGFTGGNIVIPGLRTYINNRYKQIRDDLLNNNFICDLALDVAEEEVVGATYRIYPNPTDAFVNIITEEKIPLEGINVLNILGQDVTKLVSLEHYDNTTLKLDLSSLNTGFYILKTENIIHKVYKN